MMVHGHGLARVPSRRRAVRRVERGAELALAHAQGLSGLPEDEADVSPLASGHPMGQSGIFCRGRQGFLFEEGLSCLLQGTLAAICGSHVAPGERSTAAKHAMKLRNGLHRWQQGASCAV